jgi:hypothetical protein
MRENKVSMRTMLKYLEIMAIIFLQGAQVKITLIVAQE